ncbi:hypothetical protein EV421DRAFT_2021353 [Armillaria borealis]|uniref:Nephrocystin 3-like N-terminal domain-containing protein n=1 Tax=Armillaria borealis TaxID=47425 RepID=A0AA39JCQ7_9AGAR|nr:hypothetical protein EV421DRAFT_2021353 [Armillaria borealis]
MSAVVSTKKTEGSTSSHLVPLIHEIEIRIDRPTKKSRFRVKITPDNEKPTETEESIIDRVGVTPKWTIKKSIGFDPLTKILWELHGRRRPVSHFKVLGSVEKTLGELFVLFEGNNTSADIHLSNGSSEVAVLKISGQLDTPKNVMTDVVANTNEPSESSELLDSETLQKVFEVVKQMIDTLAEAHPAATIAWGFLSIVFEMQVVKKQHDTKQEIFDLYADMISTYEDFSKDNILEQRVRLQGIYNSLFKQTIECAIFIECYAKKSGIKHLFEMDISGQAAKFRQAFVDLKHHLSMGSVKEAVIVTLGVQKSVDILGAPFSAAVLDLHPPQELGPKSWCTRGTCVATINVMVSWIAQCDGRTLWCKGLAGTGKSSLMGTLHELLTTNIGGRSRLAAFIRYDRIEYSKASTLITSIAYALGMFDDRIGRAISLVVQTLPLVVTLPPSAQFQFLLRNPLESLPDIGDGGPLGFGPKLSFMRLIISSRPVHRITMAFEGQDCMYPLHLDTSSESINRDIQFYLGREFATIRDDAFQEKCKALDAVKELTARASGLFIWAATVARFVHAFPGISRLQALLDTSIPSDAPEALTTLYRTALGTLVSEPGANADIKKYVRSVLGAVLVTQTPPGMTEDVLDNVVLLGEGSPPSRHIVSMLGSVLSPETKDSPIRLIHKSLDDFLQDQSRCGDEWFIDATALELFQFTSFFRRYFLPWLDIVVTDGDVLHFEVMGMFCRQHDLTRLSIKVNIQDSVKFHNVLKQSTRFYRHLHQSSKESSLSGKFTLECMKLRHTEKSWEPTGSNLNKDGVVFVEANRRTRYGFKIANATLVPLYLSVFCFHVSDLSIMSYYQTGSVKTADDAPLPPGETLTIGYGMSGTRPHGYYVPEGQEVDVGFLKLFFSTEYPDLSAIIQEPPFKDDRQSDPPTAGKTPSLCHTIKGERVLRSIFASRGWPGFWNEYEDLTDSDFDDSEDDSDID